MYTPPLNEEEEEFQDQLSELDALFKVKPLIKVPLVTDPPEPEVELDYTGVGADIPTERVKDFYELTKPENGITDPVYRAKEKVEEVDFDEELDEEGDVDDEEYLKSCSSSALINCLGYDIDNLSKDIEDVILKYEETDRCNHGMAAVLLSYLKQAQQILTYDDDE